MDKTTSETWVSPEARARLLSWAAPWVASCCDWKRSRCEYRLYLVSIWLQTSCFMSLYLDFSVSERQPWLVWGQLWELSERRWNESTSATTGIPSLYPFLLSLDFTLYHDQTWLVFQNLSACPQPSPHLVRSGLALWVPALSSTDSLSTAECVAHSVLLSTLVSPWQLKHVHRSGPKPWQVLFWIWSRHPDVCSD